MTKTKIALAGIEGSFSEEAALTYARKKGYEPELVYAVTAADCFGAVLKDQTADLGVVALENSNGGVVHETVYAMAQYLFSIEEIFEIDVRQNLMVKPGTNPGDVTLITSHPQALAQCKMYLKRKWSGVDLKEHADTALAAKDLAEGKLPSTAAVIASSRAADLFELEILEPNVQDLKFNFTSFLAIRPAR